MTRLPADPAGRLAILENARAAIEPGLIVNASELENVVRLTWKRISKAIDEDSDFPVIARGGMGVSWQFDAAAVLDHLIARTKQRMADREAHQDRASRLAGLGGVAPPSSEAPAPIAMRSDPAETLAQARAINALIDAQAKLRSERVRQGALVERTKVDALLADMMTTMQAETLGVAGKVDRSGQLPPEMRAQIDEELRNVLVTVRDRLERNLDEWRGPFD